MEKDQGIRRRWQMQVMYEAQKNNAPPPAWVRNASRNRVSQTKQSTLKALTVKWAVENGLLPEEIICFK